MNDMTVRRLAEPLRIPASHCPIDPRWRDAEAIALWPDRAPGWSFVAGSRSSELPPSFLTQIERPELRVFRPQAANGAALLVLPGGGYGFVSIQNEGLDIADAFCPRGYTVFVLVYRLPGEGWANRADVPLQDAQRAMRLIRARAAAEGFGADKVAVLGFSAGGHLAASLLTEGEAPLYDPVDAADALPARPQAGGLLYPVAAVSGPDAHVASAVALLGEAPGDDDLARRSPARHVDTATPPMFVAHAIDDGIVPWRNAAAMVNAMTDAGRPVELHLFQEGGHGFGVGPANGPAGGWPCLFARWLERILPLAAGAGD